MKTTPIDPSTWYQVVKELEKQLNITFDEVLVIAYNSIVYQLREDERSGLYSHSPLDIADLIRFELQGKLKEALLEGN